MQKGEKMKKRFVKKKVHENTNSCSWFDTENARLIILCALFGFLGVHKFAQGKKVQGWVFIALDLTIFGILITLIWSFFDLLFLTIRKDNKPGNMIFGACFLVFNLLFACFAPSTTVVEVGKVTDKTPVISEQNNQPTFDIEIEDENLKTEQ